MAFQTISVASMFLLLGFSFLVVMQLLNSSAGCHAGTGCINVKAVLQQEKHRKMVVSHLGGKKRVFKNGVARPTAGGGANHSENPNGWELREAPMGPDPLHHHGGGPKKPWTP